MLWKLKGKCIVAYFFAFLLGLGCLANANAGAVRSGFNDNMLAANDDGSTGLTPLNFKINFYGLTFDSLYVNNNGNVTFNAALGNYTPFDLTSTAAQIIAPFFADVDTTGVGSDIVTYSFGTGTVSGRDAFGVNWVNVGYYSGNTDKLNSFQLVIINRSDIAPGDFDFEFNYDQIQWETGDYSGGSGGLGGDSARAGYSNGTGDPGTFFEISGSAVNGAFLDSNSDTGLIHNSLNSEILGRYVFQVRRGAVSEELINLTPESATNPLGAEHTVTATVQDNNGSFLEGREVTFNIVSGPHAGMTGTDETDPNGEATFTYTGTVAGADVIEASFINSQGETITSNQVTKTWEETTAVELISFKARTNADGSVTVTWETATEVDNAGFNVYRAGGDGGRYTRINEKLIAAKGSATSGARYKFVDNSGGGKSYYMLEDVDSNGKSTSHGPVTNKAVRLRR